MRKDIVLAVAVLSVLAGLLTVGYAQNRDDDGPDAFELRRQLIDRIEDDVSRDDTDGLALMLELGDLRDAVEAKKRTMTEAELDGLVTEAERDGLVSVSQPVCDAVAAVLICDSLYNRRLNKCASNRMACDRQAHAADRSRRRRDESKLRKEINDLKLERALLRCENRELRCVSVANQKRATCHWLVSLLPC